MFMFNLCGFNWGIDDFFGIYFGEIVLQDNSSGYLLAMGFSPKHKVFRLDILLLGLILGGCQHEE
jgi:hypothetical protein